MFVFGKLASKRRIFPSEILPQPQPSLDATVLLDDDDCDQTFLSQYISESNSDLLNVEQLPGAFSTESRRLFKIPEFGQKYSSTISHLAHQIDMVLVDIMAELYPNVVYFQPDIMEESFECISSSSTIQKNPSHLPFSSTTSSTSSGYLGTKLSEVNCCLWILQESLHSFGTMKTEPGQRIPIPTSQFVKVKLQSMVKSLDTLKDHLTEYLYKFDNQQQLLAAIVTEIKSNYQKYKSRAKEHYQKYLISCEPDKLRPLDEKYRILDEQHKHLRMKFMYTPDGYSVVQEEKLVGELSAARDDIFSPSPFRCNSATQIRTTSCTLPPRLQSEIMYPIIRDLEYRIIKCVLETKPTLSKLTTDHQTEGIRRPLYRLLHLAQYSGLKLDPGAAISIQFALKRVKSKMELFKDVLVKYERAVSDTKHMIQNLNKIHGKPNLTAKLLRKAVGDGDISDMVVGSRTPGCGGLRLEQMLRDVRSKLVKDCNKLEIALYTDWPDCFKEYMIIPAAGAGGDSIIELGNRLRKQLQEEEGDGDM